MVNFMFGEMANLRNFAPRPTNYKNAKTHENLQGSEMS